MTERHPAPIGPDDGWRTWVIGALFTGIVTVGGLSYRAVDQRITVLETYGSPAMRERMAAQEERQVAIQRQLQDNAQTMKRVEEKLDIALERLHAFAQRP